MNINDKMIKKEYLLYNNPSGVLGNVTLSDSVSNYDYIEVHYKNSDNFYGYTKIYSPNGKQCSLNLTYYNSGTNAFTHFGGTISFSGNIIIHGLDYYTSNSTVPISINYIRIVRVVGIKLK